MVWWQKRATTAAPSRCPWGDMGGCNMTLLEALWFVFTSCFLPFRDMSIWDASFFKTCVPTCHWPFCCSTLIFLYRFIDNTQLNYSLILNQAKHLMLSIWKNNKGFAELSSPCLHLKDDWRPWNCWTLHFMLNERSFLTELSSSVLFFSPFIQYIHLINCCRQEKLVKLKSTQSVLTTTHWEALWGGWSSWFCCFGVGSSWCIFWVFDWSFSRVQSFFPLWPQRGVKWCVEACHPLISF